MSPRRRWLLLASASTLIGAAARSATRPTLAAPNVVVISPQLVTSGQPSAESLATLAVQGFAADIYLAPSTVPDAVPDEAGIVTRQGLVYVNIPIKFNNPTDADFAAFNAALLPWQGRKVLVHCQVNMRASSMVFLHRVIVGKEDPEKAYESVAAVWSPDGAWKRFIVSMLRMHQIPFEPY